MNGKWAIGLAALAVAAILAGCKDTRTHGDERLGMTIELPRKWTAKDAGGPELMAFLPSKPGDAFQPFMDVGMEAVDKGATLEGYRKKQLSAVSTTYVVEQPKDASAPPPTPKAMRTPGYEELEVADTKIDGRDAVLTVYACQLSELKAQVLAYHWVDEGRGFRIICTAPREQFNTYKPIFEKAVKTVKILPPTKAK